MLLLTTLALAIYPALVAATRQVALIAVLAGLAGIFQGGFDLVFFDELMKRVPPDQAPLFVSFDQSMQNLAAMVAPLVGTLLAESGWPGRRAAVQRRAAPDRLFLVRARQPPARTAALAERLPALCYNFGMPVPASIDQLRSVIRPMLDDRSTADALAVYYALHHPADRTELFLHPSDPAAGPPRGFLVRARTGMDLFRPLVTARLHDAETAGTLFERGLIAGRPVYLTLPEDEARWANKYLQMTEVELHRIYRYMPENYQPEINVLVTASTGADGLPHCEIRAADRAGAVAGGQLAVAALRRGLRLHRSGRARPRLGQVGGASTGGVTILKSGRLPLYVVAETERVLHPAGRSRRLSRHRPSRVCRTGSEGDPWLKRRTLFRTVSCGARPRPASRWKASHQRGFLEMGAAARQDSGRQLSGDACDWWNGRRWQEDFDRAAADGHNALRMSVEWSRVQPARDRWDEQALDHYREMVQGLRQRGLTPMVTLHHFVNPQWATEPTHIWETGEAAALFEAYVRKVVAALGEYVNLWCTINEPNMYMIQGWVRGAIPPEKHDIRLAFTVAANLLRAHAAAYRAIHALQPNAIVGPADQLPLDGAGAGRHGAGSVGGAHTVQHRQHALQRCGGQRAAAAAS